MRWRLGTSPHLANSDIKRSVIVCGCGHLAHKNALVPRRVVQRGRSLVGPPFALPLLSDRLFCCVAHLNSPSFSVCHCISEFCCIAISKFGSSVTAATRTSFQT